MDADFIKYKNRLKLDSYFDREYAYYTSYLNKIINLDIKEIENIKDNDTNEIFKFITKNNLFITSIYDNKNTKSYLQIENYLEFIKSIPDDKINIYYKLSEMIKTILISNYVISLNNMTCAEIIISINDLSENITNSVINIKNKILNDKNNIPDSVIEYCNKDLNYEHSEIIKEIIDYVDINSYINTEKDINNKDYTIYKLFDENYLNKLEITDNDKLLISNINIKNIKNNIINAIAKINESIHIKNDTTFKLTYINIIKLLNQIEKSFFIDELKSNSSNVQTEILEDDDEYYHDLINIKKYNEDIQSKIKAMTELNNKLANTIDANFKDLINNITKDINSNDELSKDVCKYVNNLVDDYQINFRNSQSNEKFLTIENITIMGIVALGGASILYGAYKLWTNIYNNEYDNIEIYDNEKIEYSRLNMI